MTRYAALALLLAASPAGAFFFNTGVKQYVGSDDYVGTSLYAHFGDDINLRPSFSIYKSDVSSGTYKTLSLRLGYDTKLFGLGFTAGGSPKVNGYSNTFFGVDGVVSLSPTGSGPVKRIKGGDQGGGKARGKGLARVDLGAAILHTVHRDEFQAGGTGGKGPASRRATSLSIGQTDLTGSAGVSLLDNLISVDLTKSFYSRDLEAVSARAAQIEALQGLNAVIQGFPDTNAYVKVEMGMVPVVEPFVSYTRTTYKLGLSPSHAYTVGAYFELMILELTASYQRYVQTGFKDQNYYGLGASVRF